MYKFAILFITCISISSCVNFDRASNNYYYHNGRTNVTQWEIPDDYMEQVQSHAEVLGAGNDPLESTALFHSKKPGTRVLMTYIISC